jgi:hypothetical protein
MPVSESDVVRLRWRIGVMLVTRQVTGVLAAWAFVWGTAVVVLRVTLNVAAIDLLWGLAAVPFLIVIAFIMAWRRVPTGASVRALLDRTSGAGGLLLAAAERSLDGWAQALPPAPRLRLRWHGQKVWALLAAGLVFLAVGLFFPEHLVARPTHLSLEIGNEVAKLASQLETLKETEVLEPERAESLEQKLKQLKDKTAGEDPAKTLEALDHVQQVASQAAKEAAETAAQKTERLAQAETLAEGLQQAAGEIDAKLQAEAMAELARLAEKAAQENKALGKDFDPKRLKNGKAEKLDPEQLKKLAEALRGARHDIIRNLEKLHQAKLVDLEALTKCENCGRCNGDKMAQCLKAGGKQSVKKMLSQCQRPGRGGLNDGPAAAELTWGDPSSEKGVKFKEEALPPSALEALKESQVVGVGKAAPAAEKNSQPSQPGALGQAAAGAGSAQTQVILPRYRAAVERYFERSRRTSAP